MTVSTASVSLESLLNLPDRVNLLLALKDLKNSVIGNTWKKVEVAADEDLRDFMLQQLAVTELSDQTNLDIINETSVIIGSLASDGPLTLRPLVLAQVPNRLLALVHSLSQTPLSKSQQIKVLPSVLRALRNILVSAADAVWGHVWGVGAERKVVGTGLVGEDIGEVVGKGKGVSMGGHEWRIEAVSAMRSIFENRNLTTLLSVLRTQDHPQILLAIYQLLSRLIVLPSHREALARWDPPADQLGVARAGPSRGAMVDPGGSMLFRSTTIPTSVLPFILQHLIDIIANPDRGSRRVTPKALEAALELLASLVKHQPTLAGLLRMWAPGTGEETILEPTPGPSFATLRSPISEKEQQLPEVFSILLDLLETGSTPVRIAAASCLANLLKAEKHPRTSPYTSIHLQLLGTVTELLQTEAFDDKVKLCFVTSTIVTDEAGLAKVAGEQGCPQRIIQFLDDIEKGDEKGEISQDVASRAREGSLLALAALAFPLDSIRVIVTESDPPCLPYLLRALSHQSYGVRAAACQLARALSRTVSLVRTTLNDSGIADAVIDTLVREVSERKSRSRRRKATNGSGEVENEEVWGDRSCTVEITAMMTLSNLIADFSPIKETLLSGPAIDTICELTYSPHELLAVNAMWTIKNAMFKSTDAVKARLLSALGVHHLTSMLAASTSTPLRIQAFRIIQNYLADGNASDLTKAVEQMGEGDMLDEVALAMQEGNDVELRSAALGVLINLSWGNERLRQSITNRPDLMESLSRALDSKHDEIKYPALKSLQNLITSTVKSSRPRQAMLDAFQPYQLKPRVKELLDTSPSLEVTTAATALHEVLEKARDGVEILREDVLDR